MWCKQHEESTHVRAGGHLVTCEMEAVHPHGNTHICEWVIRGFPILSSVRRPVDRRCVSCDEDGTGLGLCVGRGADCRGKRALSGRWWACCRTHWQWRVSLCHVRVDPVTNARTRTHASAYAHTKHVARVSCLPKQRGRGRSLAPGATPRVSGRAPPRDPTARSSS